jgi:hypothetical protein
MREVIDRAEIREKFETLLLIAGDQRVVLLAGAVD